MTAGVATPCRDCGDLRRRLAQLEVERLEILGELEEAYERFAHSVDDSRKETDLVYRELRDKADSLEKRVGELVTLAEAARSISSVLDLDSALDCVIEHAGTVISADGAALYLRADNGDLVFRAGRGLPRDAYVRLGARLRPMVSSGQVAMSRPVIAHDLGGHPLSDVLDLDPDASSAVLLPLHGTGDLVGVVLLTSAVPGAFCAEQESLLTTFAAQASIALTNARLYRDLERTVIGILMALATALEAKDQYTEGHSARVAWYGVVLGKEMGLKAEDLENVHRAGLIHDIGKIGIGGSILRKPGPLNEDEWLKMRMHPQVGADIIGSIDLLSGALPGVRQHHERWDGSGYPDGVAGEDIPLIARILSVADAFDALTSDRSYRKGCSPQAALAEIARWSGTQFDPRVVAALERCLPEIMEEGSEEEKEAA